MGSEGLTTRSLGSCALQGHCPQPDCSRPTFSIGDGFQLSKNLWGGPVPLPPPLGPGIGSPEPSRAAQSREPRSHCLSLSPEPWVPRLLLAARVHALTPVWLSVRQFLASMWLLSSVRVSMCPSPCACDSWRHHGVHVGTEPAWGIREVAGGQTS